VSKIPRLKPKVQVQKADVSLDALITVLKEYVNIPQRVLNRAAEIIADKIEEVGYVVTEEPSVAKQKFENMFSKITVTTPVTADEVKSSDPKRYTYYAGDEESLNSMLEGVRTRGSTVKLSDPVNVIREKRVVMVGDHFELQKDTHAVSYVTCHIGGFTKFVRAGGNVVSPYDGEGYGPSRTWQGVNTGWVKGRDVIYSSVLMAKADILKDVRDDIIKRLR